MKSTDLYEQRKEGRLKGRETTTDSAAEWWLVILGIIGSKPFRGLAIKHGNIIIKMFLIWEF